MMLIDTSSWISLDEFSAISTDRPHRGGWGKKGSKLYVRSAPAKRHKCSGIVAIGPEGLLACCIVKGAVNKAIFIEFMTQLTSELNSIKGRTIVMDNIAFHKSKEIVQLCNNCGVNIQLTPPYSPECNPVENFFSVVKDELRTQLAMSGTPETYDEFEDVVTDIVHASAVRVHNMARLFDGFLDRAAAVPV